MQRKLKQSKKVCIWSERTFIQHILNLRKMVGTINMNKFFNVLEMKIFIFFVFVEVWLKLCHWLMMLHHLLVVLQESSIEFELAGVFDLMNWLLYWICFIMKSYANTNLLGLFEWTGGDPSVFRFTRLWERERLWERRLIEKTKHYCWKP